MAAFYERSPGAVLSSSIDKYMYISSHQYFEEDKIRVKYSKTETVSDISQLEHPILKTILHEMQIKGGWELSSIADIPSGTGMGSSSSFTVGVLHNLHAVKSMYASKEDLAAGACRVEIDLLGEPIGKQDQYAAAYGGLNVIEFQPGGTVTVSPVVLKPETSAALQDNLLMFYTGNQRSASAILAQQKKNVSQEDKFNTLKQMVQLVYELRDVLYKEQLDEFGRLLHENWLMKRSLASSISNPLIDEAYETAMKNGALGGKLLGAGGGGFMLFYCPKEKQEQLVQSLGELRVFPFRFDQRGSQIIYYSHED